MIYDRKTKSYRQLQPESRALEFLYHTMIGRFILKLVSLKFISQMLGWINNTGFSKRKVAKFVKKNHIEIDDTASFNSFNEFFIRKQEFNFDFEEEDMISVAESQLSIYDIDKHSKFMIKGQAYPLETLLDDEELARYYQGGKCLIFRLCVDNYHRYCYFDSGTVIKNKYISGCLHTVRPIAYEKYRPLIQNTRNYALLNTDNFGQALFMEVGAIMVGKFVNHASSKFEKGAERGYFELGGSTIVVLLEKDSFELDEDLLPLVNTGTEVAVKYGEKIGSAL